VPGGRVLAGQRQRLRGLLDRHGGHWSGPVGVLPMPARPVLRCRGERVPAVLGGPVLARRHGCVHVVRGGHRGELCRPDRLHGLRRWGLRGRRGERVRAVPAGHVLGRGHGGVCVLPGGHRRVGCGPGRVRGVRCGQVLGRWGERVPAVLGGRVLRGQCERVHRVRGWAVLGCWSERVPGVHCRDAFERWGEPVRAVPGGVHLVERGLGVWGLPARELRRGWVERGESSGFIRV
jgi:hypothetical protein